jgi:hypothetical protein
MCSHDLFGCGSVALGKASLNAGAETESLRSATRQLSAVSYQLSASRTRPQPSVPTMTASTNALQLEASKAALIVMVS